MSEGKLEVSWQIYTWCFSSSIHHPFRKIPSASCARQKHRVPGGAGGVCGLSTRRRLVHRHLKIKIWIQDAVIDAKRPAKLFTTKNIQANKSHWHLEPFKTIIYTKRDKQGKRVHHYSSLFLVFCWLFLIHFRPGNSRFKTSGFGCSRRWPHRPTGIVFKDTQIIPWISSHIVFQNFVASKKWCLEEASTGKRCFTSAWSHGP